MLLAILLRFPQEDPARLIETLRSERVEEREGAARSLKALGPAAVPALEKAAKDADAEVAARARSILRVIHVAAKLDPNLRKEFPGLEETLVAGGNREWTRALFEAVRTGDDRKPAHPSLTPEDLAVLAVPAARGAEEPEERKAVCEAFVYGRLRSLAGELTPFLKDADGDVLTTAMTAGWTLGFKEMVPHAVPLLLHEDDDVRRCAAYVLASFGAKDAVPGLIALIQSADDDLAIAGADALGQLGAAEGVPDLLVLLSRGEARCRAAAADALGKLRAETAVDALLALLGDQDYAVRQCAIHALARLKGKRAVPELVRLLKDEETGDSAAEALALTAADEAVKDVVALLKDPSAQRRSLAVYALWRMGARGSARDLEPLLGDADADVRAAAAYALWRLSKKDTSAVLRPFLDGEDGWPRRLALDGLLEMDRREEIPAMEKLLKKDEDPLSRAVVGIRLCGFGRREGAKAMLELPDNMACSLFALNALRRPELWKRAVEKRVSRRIEGTRAEVVERLAAELGLAAELPDDIDWSLYALPGWWRGAVVPGDDRLSVAEALEETLDHQVVLEPGRLRVLSLNEARTFWREWDAGAK